jgi:hypothetical protein
MMRERIGSAWPVLSERYGLHPWHAGGPRELTVSEARAYVEHLEETAARAERERAMRAAGHG